MKKIFLGLMMLVMTYGAQAQFRTGSSVFLVGWEIGVPVSNDYISQASFGGGYFDWRKFVKPNLSLGFQTSFNFFRQFVDTKTYVSNDQLTAVTTNMVRRQTTFPLMFNACYYFHDMGIASPYVGLGVGALYSDQWMFYSQYNSSNRDWGFNLRPTVGAILHFGPEVGGHVAIGYDYAPMDNGFTEQNSIQYLYIQLGVSFYSGAR
jgi:outer membrane protein W